MAIFLSAARSGQLVDELRAGGYPDDTPVVVAYKVTWPDELILHTTIGELAETVKQHKLWRHTLFLVGKALRPRAPGHTCTTPVTSTPTARPTRWPDASCARPRRGRDQGQGRLADADQPVGLGNGPGQGSGTRGSGVGRGLVGGARLAGDGAVGHSQRLSQAGDRCAAPGPPGAGDQETLALESTPPTPEAKPKLAAVPERPRPQRQGQGKKTARNASRARKPRVARRWR